MEGLLTSKSTLPAAARSIVDSVMVALSGQKAADTQGSVVIESLDSLSSNQMLDNARKLLTDYGGFVAAKPGIAHFCYGALESEVASLPNSYTENGGGVLLASIDSRHIGFVAWRTLPNPALANAWEVKRLWVTPAARCKGIGRILVEAIIDRARAAGKSELLLDTAPAEMPSAHQLYIDLGFHPCPPYDGPEMPGIQYMSLHLSTP